MSMVEKLQLVVDATTSSSEARFQRLTTKARETGDVATRSASEVAQAADRVATAQLRQADEAGKLRVAQQRLVDLYERGNASATQLAAAEEKVASSERRLHNATREVVAATDAQVRAQAEAETQAGETGRAMDDHGAALDSLRNRVAGLVAGYSLGSWLKDQTSAYLDGARGANTLSISMNATVEQGGRLSQLFSTLGLEASDLLEIQAEFATKIGANGAALAEFGAEVKTNADGTTNWALTLEDALVNLQKIPDATVRNATGFRLFGEEGYKQLSRLLSSGMSVQDALDSIGTPFSDEDVRATQEYDAAMMQLSMSSGEAGRTLARVLVPAATAVVGAVGDVVDVVGDIPLPFGLAVASVVALQLAKRSAAADGGLLAGAMSMVQGRAAGFTASVGAAAAGTGVLATTMGVARVAGTGLMATLGGPLGLAILGLGAGFAILNSLTGDNEEKAEASARANESLASALQETNGVVTESVRRQAALSAQQAGLLDVADAAGVSQGEVTRALLEGGDAYDAVMAKLLAYQEANRDVFLSDESGQTYMALNERGEAASDAAEELENLRGTTKDTVATERELAGELGNTQDKAAMATKTMETLTAASEDGATATKDYAGMARDAAAAQDAATRADETAKAAVEAHNAVTRDAVEVTRGLIDARLSAENAGYSYLSALDELNTAHDDETTSVDEVAQAHTRYKEAALGAADAAADAAVEAARQAGTILTPLTEAQTRADAMVADLRARLNEPGLSDGAKADLQGLIDQLVTAQEKGDVQALVTLTGADQVAGELDEATEDRDATVAVESRGGPAVDHYLDGLASQARLAIVRVESRGGPAVDDYLDGLRGRTRLAIIRVESRGGPAVDDYLGALARKDRLAIIRVETRGGPAVDAYLDNLAGQSRTAVIDVQRNGTGAPGSPTGAPQIYGAPAIAGAYGASGGDVVVQQLTVQVVGDGAGRISQQSLADGGRQLVRQLSAYTRQNGPGWMKGLNR